MADFYLSSKAEPQWYGGPPAYCHVCNFVDPTNPGFLISPAVQVVMHDNIEVNLHLCLSQHAAALKVVLDEQFPDERLPAAQAKLFQAEAARARAEKRANLAEAALTALQAFKDDGVEL